MPKSKRDKPISLTKVTKKGLEFKQKLIHEIHEYVDKFQFIYLLHFKNLRNAQLKALREEWKPSKFLFSKNSLIYFALGKSPESEYKDGLHSVGKNLKGQCGMLFTDKPLEYVVQYFKGFGHTNFARYKVDSPKTITLPKGPLKGLTHASEKFLKKYGMPVILEKDTIALTEDFTLCMEGEKLTIDQSKILKMLNMPMASFKIVPYGVWSADTGEYQNI
ncbi:unnamed protein product [Gordionus sp. m RMFG-2023]|uniref:mRNA turnover protein 4 homolog n=1 Tax=Gordionus sp. m RMFG-2023 TaxID=3053472 RepID=UPI0030E5CF37